MPCCRPPAAVGRATGGWARVAATGAALLLLTVAACGGHPTEPTAPLSLPSQLGSSGTASPSPTSTAQLPLLFSPASVSFATDTVGYALGVAACVTGGTTLCTGLARTTDGGQHWRPATAPPLLALADPAHQPLLRFADPQTGFATDGRPGTGLLVTHDGGTTWAALTGLPATVAVESVVTDGGHVVVVAGDASGAHLWVGTTGGTALALGGPALPVGATVVDTAVSGERAYVVASTGTGPVAAWRSTGLESWTPMTVPCTAGGSARVAAAGDRVVVVCQDPAQGAQAAKRLWVSADAGGSFTAEGGLNADGHASAVALGSARTLTVASSSDTDQLQASTDGGGTFSVAYASAVGGQGQGLFDLAYVDAEHAFVVLGTAAAYAQALAAGVRGQPGPRLLATVDGGLHWTQVQVRS